MFPQLLPKNIFTIIRENGANHKPNNSNIKHSITTRCYLSTNFYYINDILKPQAFNNL